MCVPVCIYTHDCGVGVKSYHTIHISEYTNCPQVTVGVQVYNELEVMYDTDDYSLTYVMYW